jgi:hypothetical protein
MDYFLDYFSFIISLFFLAFHYISYFNKIVLEEGKGYDIDKVSEMPQELFVHSSR